MSTYRNRTDDELTELFAPEATNVSLMALGPALVQEQVAELLSEREGDPDEAEYIGERIHTAAMTNVVEAITSAVYDGDNKFDRLGLAQQIADWLADGDLTGTETVEQLAAEWREYDVPEETA